MSSSDRERDRDRAPPQQVTCAVSWRRESSPVFHHRSRVASPPPVESPKHIQASTKVSVNTHSIFPLLTPSSFPTSDQSYEETRVQDQFGLGGWAATPPDWDRESRVREMREKEEKEFGASLTVSL